MWQGVSSQVERRLCPRAEVIRMGDTGNIEVRLLLGVCAVVLALLLVAGDVERNPGPTGKEGS